MTNAEKQESFEQKGWIFVINEKAKSFQAIKRRSRRQRTLRASGRTMSNLLKEVKSIDEKY